MATRQTTGMVANLLNLANLDRAVPDYSTLFRWQTAPLTLHDLKAHGERIAASHPNRQTTEIQSRFNALGTAGKGEGMLQA